MAHVSDDSLLFAAARSRDGEAIAEIIRRYGELFYSIALRVFSSTDRAEELSRDLAIELAHAPSMVRGEPAVWMHEKATRRAMQTAPTNGTARHRDPAEEPQWDEICHTIDPTLLQLNRRHRHIIIQHYFQRHGQDDLAEMLQVAQPIVAQRLRKALEALRLKLVAAGAGCSLGQLMMLLARHAASEAPQGWVDHLCSEAAREHAIGTSKRKGGWLGLLTVWTIIVGLITAVAASYSAGRNSASATTTTRPAK